MPRYYVTVPATAAIHMTIDAESEEEAKKKVWEVDFLLNLESSDPASPELGEFELHKYVTRGNVCYAVQNDIDVEEAD